MSTTRKAKKDLDEFGRLEGPSYPPCSVNIRKVHNTYDFAKNVSLPHNTRQVSPISSKTTRKVHILGVNTKAIPKQVNRLIGESKTIGLKEKSSNGPNTVISLLHHFLQPKAKVRKKPSVMLISVADKIKYL